MSKSEYKKSKTQVLDLIKISNSNLLNIVKEKEYSKIIFIGNPFFAGNKYSWFFSFKLPLITGKNKFPIGNFTVVAISTR